MEDVVVLDDEAIRVFFVFWTIEMSTRNGKEGEREERQVDTSISRSENQTQAPAIS